MNETRGLWRGKRKVYHNYVTDQDVFKWVEGYYVSNGADLHYIITAEFVQHLVDPSTLGECTGKRDKNGKLIFEGDVVLVNHPYNGRSIHEVVWGEYHWNLDKFYASCFDYPTVAFSEGTKYMSVIGNVHDTPELLEGADNKGCVTNAE